MSVRDPCEKLGGFAAPRSTMERLRVGIDPGDRQLNNGAMNQRTDAHDDAVVFHQDRRKLVGVGLIGIAFVAMGISFITDPEFWKTVRHSRDYIEVVGWIIAPLFSLALVAVAVSLARPTRVELGPEGVTISTAWRTYSRPWDAVGDFKIWKYQLNRTVVFNDSAPPNLRFAEINRRLTGATSAMPTALNVDPEQLLTAVVAAKRRWGGANVRNARRL